MGSQRGKLITCDRCGESIFLKELNMTFEYEKQPDDWKTVGFGNWNIVPNAFTYSLCPRCSELFEKYRDMFFGIEEKDDDQA